MALVPFGKPSKAATYQDKRSGRMPKQLKSKEQKTNSPGDGDGGVRGVDPGDGLVRGNDIPSPLPGAPAKE